MGKDGKTIIEMQTRARKGGARGEKQNVVHCLIACGKFVVEKLPTTTTIVTATTTTSYCN